MNNNYQLVIKIPIEALDSPDARKKAREILKKTRMGLACEKTDIKLQRLHQGKPPEGVIIEKKPS